MKKNAKFWKALPVVGAILASVLMLINAWVNMNVVTYAFEVLVIACILDIVLVNFDRDENGDYVICASYADALTKSLFWVSLVVLMSVAIEYLILHYNNMFGMDIFMSDEIQIPFWWCIGCGVLRLSYRTNVLPSIA